jgi:hypothetical protein
MNHKVGDMVRIRSKEWIDAHDNLLSSGAFIVPMFEYAGKMATITMVTQDSYHLDIDNCKYWWTDEMFYPDYSPAEPLSAEDAARAMLNGEILFNKEGEEHYWGTGFIIGEERKDFFVKKEGFRQFSSFENLYRNIPKIIRTMTKDEAMAWASGSESLGWMVRCSFQNWDFPRTFGYHGTIKSYQRARMLPDLSGIDESTIQGFKVEE